MDGKNKIVQDKKSIEGGERLAASSMNTLHFFAAMAMSGYAASRSSVGGPDPVEAARFGARAARELAMELGIQ